MQAPYQRLAQRIETDGFSMIEGCLDRVAIATLLAQISHIKPQISARIRQGHTYAVRNLLAVAPHIKALALCSPLIDIARSLLGHQARPVKGTLFDKNEAANWKVPWHQDKVISVQNYADEPGFGPWSTKQEAYSVQPPIEILKQMLALRIHLDDCGITNGVLKVIPGSHRHGKLSTQQIAQYQKQDAVVCNAKIGDVLAMRPLLLHQSSAGTQPTHRRVIHIEYAAGELPGDLSWPCHTVLDIEAN